MGVAINLEKILYIVITICCVFFTSSFSIENKGLLILAIFLNLRLIYTYRNVLPVLILFSFIFSYLVPFIYYFYYKTEVTVHPAFNTAYYLGMVVRIFSLFLLSVFLYAPRPDSYVYISERLNYKKSTYKYYALLIVTFLLFHFGLDGQSLLSGAYGSIEKNQSALYEYTLIFLAILPIYSKVSARQKYMFFLMVCMIVLKDILYGGRVTSIQVLLLTYVMYYEKSISRRKMYLSLMFVALIMKVFVTVRSNPILFLSGNFTIADLFPISQSNTLSSNQGDIAQSSARLIGFVETNILDLDKRISSLFYSFISIFTPGFTLSDLANLASYKKDLYNAGGGALFPVYFYVWLSYPGVILSGYIVSRIIKIFLQSKNIYLILFSCLVVCTFPRWFVYNPINMFKLCGYVIPVYFLVKKVKLIKSEYSY